MFGCAVRARIASILFPRRLGAQVPAGREAQLGAQGGALPWAIGTSHLLSSWEIRENVLVSPKSYATL